MNIKSNDWKDTAELIGIAAIVLGLVLVAYELRQNTQMMRAQTRDSLTEKQMMFSGWIGTSEYAANVLLRGTEGQLEPGTPEYYSHGFLLHGIFREWENSFYQYEQGLFDESEFQPRRNRWRVNMALPGYRDFWAGGAEMFAPGFKAEIDAIVAEIDAESDSE
jgi:hypothetical protein